MMSESRAKSIDHYFTSDHAARQRHFVIATAVGTIALILCQTLAISALLSLMVVTLAIAATFLIALFSAIVPNLWESAQNLGCAVNLRKTPTESKNLKEGRRGLVVRLSAVAASMFFLAILPKYSEAEIADMQIRRFLKEGKTSEARAAIGNALDLGIPLKPELVIATTSQTGIGLQQTYGKKESALVEVYKNERITISLPVVYVPAGVWPSDQPEKSGETPISVIGVGPDKATIVPERLGANRFSALITHSATKRNTLVYGLTIAAPLDSPEPSEIRFLDAEKGSSAAVASDIVVRSLHQIPDRIIWLNTTFVRCVVTLAGDWFRMTNVKFDDCELRSQITSNPPCVAV